MIEEEMVELFAPDFTSCIKRMLRGIELQAQYDFFYACVTGNLNRVKMMVEKDEMKPDLVGIEPDFDGDINTHYLGSIAGKNALHLIASRKKYNSEKDLEKRKETVKYLLQCGVSPLIKDNSNKTAIDIATQNGNLEFLEIVKEMNNTN